jgi:hypothetical protein
MIRLSFGESTGWKFLAAAGAALAFVTWTELVKFQRKQLELDESLTGAIGATHALATAAVVMNGATVAEALQEMASADVKHERKPFNWREEEGLHDEETERIADEKGEDES